MTTNRIDNILSAVYQKVQTLIPADRFYVILYDPKKEEITFPFVGTESERVPKSLTRGTKLSYDPGSRLPDYLVCQAENVLLEQDLPSRLAKLSVKYWPGIEPPHSWLGIPLRVGDRSIGALVAESWDPSRSFNASDQDLLTTFARQAAMAITNARQHEDLERKIGNLRILSDSGQQLTRGLVKQRDEILELLYESATKLQMDTRNMYIAFYEPDLDRPDTEEEVNGRLHFALSYEEGQPVSMTDRPAMDGLTGVVIRTKESFNPPDVQAVHEQLAVTHRRRIPRSWLGVPMLSEGQVFGVIVLRDYDHGNTYTDDDEEMLEILAGQAAVALQNLRLFQAQQREQERRKAAENLGVMSHVAAEFAHKMNNLAGTIPVRIELAKSQLASTDSDRDEKVLEQLMKIEREAKGLLDAAQVIRRSNEETPEEEVDIGELLEIAIARAENNRKRQNSVQVVRDKAENLPAILAPRNALLDTLTSILKNAFEAIDESGSVTIKTQRTRLEGQDAIEIQVSDDGRGIPPSALPKIFDLFFSTKGESGLGFGLWRDKFIIMRMGGEIDVQSKEGKGSTFTLRIPTKQKITALREPL